jgi:hypothetical protein
VSFDHWWLGLLLDPGDVERIAPEFAAAEAAAILSPEATRALAAWRAQPTRFGRDAAGELVDAFIWAFNLPGFDALAERLCTDGDAYGNLLAPERVFRFAMIARHTPVSIVWQALGDARAAQLPGRMGNLLLRPAEVAGALAAVERAYDGLPERAMLDAATAYCGVDASGNELSDVIGFLPEGLARAAAEGKGFLSLARAQV